MGKRRDCWSAGHGYGSRTPGKTDSGAVGYGIEAQKARALALRLAQDSAALSIPTLFRDHGPYYLADNEADEFGATRFREVHFDAGPKKASGASVLVGPDASPFELKMARAYLDAICGVLEIPSRGIDVRDDLAVLRQYPDMASCLIEVAFITSSKDMERYDARRFALELALVNADRALTGLRPMAKLPRTTWRKRRIPRYLTTT